MPGVAITQDRSNIEGAVRSALDLLDIEPLVRGKLVAVKPNDTWASAGDITGVTQADTLRAVLRYLKRSTRANSWPAAARGPLKPMKSSASAA
jgi:uncharacterized protein (DUF362 family)